MNKILPILLIATFHFTFSPKNIQAQSRPTIDYWQDATLDGGLVLFSQLMELNGDEALVLGGIAALAYWAGYDMFCIKFGFSNSSYSTIYAYPATFKIKEYKGGKSYSLDFFLVYRDGKIQNWSSVTMPPNSSIELYGYFFAPKEFSGMYLSTN